MAPPFYVKVAQRLFQTFQYLPEETRERSRPIIWRRFGAPTSRLNFSIPRKPLLIDRSDEILQVGAVNHFIIDHYRTLVGRGGSIKIIEPDKRNYEKLADYSEPFSNVSVHRLAIAPENGTVEFFTNSEDPSSGRVADDPDEHVTTYDDAQTVEALSLDEICIEYSYNPDYIEVMTNGTERMIIESGQNLLSETSPKLLIKAYGAGTEEDSDLNKLKNILWGCGFKVVSAPVRENPKRYWPDGDIFAYKQ